MPAKSTSPKRNSYRHQPRRSKHVERRRNRFYFIINIPKEVSGGSAEIAACSGSAPTARPWPRSARPS